VKLENEFTVPAPIEQAWAVLLDVERVAPCLPGAQVEPGGDGGEYTGTMTVKIGPITSRYKGTVKIEQADEAGRVAIMRAQAKDARGQGTAAATITSSMEQAPEGTKVKVVTDMRITGPAAQFGRGVMQDVSAKLMRQFAECLAAEMSATPVEPNGGVTEPEPETAAQEPVGAPADGDAAASPPPPRPEHRAPEVLDLGEASREAVLKRAIPLVAGVIALIVVLRLIRRR
jgi:carbon monoxide dehydrogenase subunit G